MVEQPNKLKIICDRIVAKLSGAYGHSVVETLAEDFANKRMRLVLQASHRFLHIRMHQPGHYHDHTAVIHHP